MLLLPALTAALAATVAASPVAPGHTPAERSANYVPDWIAGAGRDELLTSVSILSSWWRPHEGALVAGASNQHLADGALDAGTVFAPWHLGDNNTRGGRLCTYVIAQHGEKSLSVRDRTHFSLPRFMRENGLQWHRLRGMQCWPRSEVHAPPQLVVSTTAQPTPTGEVPPSGSATTATFPKPGATETTEAPGPETTTTVQPTPSSDTPPITQSTTEIPTPATTSDTANSTPTGGFSSMTPVESTTAPGPAETTAGESTTSPIIGTGLPSTATLVPTDSSSAVVPPGTTIATTPTVVTTSADVTVAPNATTTANITIAPNVTTMPNLTTMPNVTALPNATTTGYTTALPNATSTPTTSVMTPSASATVTVNGNTFINKGLVAAGAIPATLPDFLNHSVGAIGALHFVGLWPAQRGFTGQLLIQPDRGLGGTTDFYQRYSYLNFELHPHTGSDALSAAAGRQTFSNFSIPWTLAYKEFGARYITGKDATWSGNASEPVPRPSETDGRRQSADSQGLAMNPDTTFWVAEGYEPSVLKMSKEAVLLRRFAAPAAFIPRRGDEVVFSIDAAAGVDKGRAPGAGFAGLAMSTDRQRVYAVLGRALLQDSPAGAAGRYSRLLAYDISSGNATLAGAYVVELPVGPDGAALPATEIHYLSDDTFVLLAGEGASQRFYLVSTADATDIAETAYTTGYDAVAPGGALRADVRAAVPVPWIDLRDDSQLARFGLSPAGLARTWAGMAVANCQDAASPHDHFVFAFSNNHFGGEDTQALVWRAEIPLGINDA